VSESFVLTSVARTLELLISFLVAAMYGDNVDILKMKDSTLSEAYWNETSTATYGSYSYSKLAAEREAWKICEAQHRWDLVVINPGFVLGPSLAPNLSPAACLW
jgi:nucleoside-diphosphate-sugar epimerase